MFTTTRRDIHAALERDPAARSRLEIALCYPGFWAVCGYRLSHRLWQAHFKMLARLFSTWLRFSTGIEIHPAAEIGPGLFIDHGAGVVIGETTKIGENATLYQGVTLGGTNTKHGKRHPTLGDCVVVGAGAKVLGAITIGDCSRIGANAVVVKDVPAGSVVVGVPGEIIAHGRSKTKAPNLAHGQMPDVLGEDVVELIKRVEKIEQRLGEQHQTPYTSEDGVWSEGENKDKD